MSDIEKVDLESKDLVAERVERLKALFPGDCRRRRWLNRFRETAAYSGRRG